jgi:cyclophilin family peptidyl-prolyl cis-trans isomerase
MSDRAWSEAIRREARTPRSLRGKCQPVLESLEGRELLTGSLAPLPNISVPAFLGYQVVLDGSGSNAPTQTFTVTSSNPDITATVGQGQFVTYNVSHTSSGPGDPAFSGNVVVEFFNDLTPMTATKIEGFIQSGYYNGLQLFRVANGFPTSSDFIIQGGSKNNMSNFQSGLPGTPFANEIVQQVAFTNSGQLAMANTGAPNSNDTQFFFTTGAATNLSFGQTNGFTIFGQVVSGLNLVDQMSQVTLQSGSSQPVNPIVMNTVSVSGTTNPNGVLHVNATQALSGETSTITVSATDPATNTSQSQSFQVTVTPNTNTVYPITLRPVAIAATQQYSVNTPQTIQLQGNNANSGQALTFAISTQPTHGTLSQLNANTGTVVYTPNTGFQGTDSFQFTVTNPTANLTSDPRAITLSTSAVQLPTAAAISTSSQFGNPVTIQLQGTPATPNQLITYGITTQPTKGTISQFNATTGTLVYTPNPGQQGSDTFQYAVTNNGPPAPGLASQPAAVTVNLVQNPVNTNAVRLISPLNSSTTVLVVTPPPGDNTSNGKNTIMISETNVSSDMSQNRIQVFVNGRLDINQPLASDITQIEVYGAKGGNTVTVSPNVDSTIPVTLIGGHGKFHKNVLQAGAGQTAEQSWFGKSALLGGMGTNELIGRAGRIKFVPTTATDQIFAGIPNTFKDVGRRFPPGGTFYKLGKHGRVIPIPAPPVTPDFQDATPPHAARRAAMAEHHKKSGHHKSTGHTSHK